MLFEWQVILQFISQSGFSFDSVFFFFSCLNTIATSTPEEKKTDTSGSIFPTTPRQWSNRHPRKGLANQIPPPPGHRKGSNARGLPGRGGGGMLKFPFHRRIKQNVTSLPPPLQNGDPISKKSNFNEAGKAVMPRSVLMTERKIIWLSKP